MRNNEMGDSSGVYDAVTKLLGEYRSSVSRGKVQMAQSKLNLATALLNSVESGGALAPPPPGMGLSQDSPGAFSVATGGAAAAPPSFKDVL